MAETSPTPNLLWRLFVVGGIGTLAAISIDDSAWEAFDDLTGGVVSRSTARVTLAGAVALHTTEALSAWRSARSGEVPHPLKWTAATLLWGGPTLLRLRKERRRIASAS